LGHGDGVGDPLIGMSTPEDSAGLVIDAIGCEWHFPREISFPLGVFNLLRSLVHEFRLKKMRFGCRMLRYPANSDVLKDSES